MKEALNRADFFEEVTPRVEKIITAEYRNIELNKVLKSLFTITEGYVDECTHTVICEVIEDLGGEPYDPDMDDTDYDEDDDENEGGSEYEDDDDY